MGYNGNRGSSRGEKDKSKEQKFIKRGRETKSLSREKAINMERQVN